MKRPRRDPLDLADVAALSLLQLSGWSKALPPIF